MRTVMDAPIPYKMVPSREDVKYDFDLHHYWYQKRLYRRHQLNVTFLSKDYESPDGTERQGTEKLFSADLDPHSFQNLCTASENPIKKILTITIKRTKKSKREEDKRRKEQEKQLRQEALDARKKNQAAA